MRGWIADTGGYAAPVGIGEVMRALSVGMVVASRSATWSEGERVMGWFGWQTLATVPASAVVCRVEHNDLPSSLALGILGINGVTAYLALTLVGAPATGETVVVSTAAGAVGSAVGQIAKSLGCRTVGIAGGREKVRLCTELFGYDVALDYREDELEARVRAACPRGVDVYFDNTSGAISDAVMRHLGLRARVVICGTAAMEAWEPWPIGPRVERHLLVKRARMEGFVIFDHMHLWADTTEKLAAFVREGWLKYREDILDGIESCPDAIAGLYRGENVGKRLIRLEPLQ